MNVNIRAANMCCRHCYPEFGKSNNRKNKKRFSRMLKRRDRQSWKKDVS